MVAAMSARTLRSHALAATIAVGCGGSSGEVAVAAPLPGPTPELAAPAQPRKVVVVPPPVDSAAQPPPRTACRAVAHIGDSTSTGMLSVDVIPDPAQRLDRQYARVGVEQFVPDNAGGRSLEEHRKTSRNGVMVAEELRAGGFRGCWVIGLGTNDAANAAKDPSVPPAQRIANMMAVIGDDPVLWIDVATRKQDGYWATTNMQGWNDALAATLARWPNARVYQWTADVQDGWYTKDGIHFTATGYIERARLVADALRAAFPDDAPR
jgi:hypothetical protein